MAKLKTDPIGQADLIEFLESSSDFSFELQVLNTLVEMGFSCEHGGSYTDRSTKKIRAFDIRATQAFDLRFLRLAVECKNIRPNNPLLVSCVPRRNEEAFHEIILSVNPDECLLEKPPEMHCRAMLARSKNIRLVGEHTAYPSGAPVGKSCTQIGRSTNGELSTSDSDVYDKWAQALSSADDLTLLACSDGDDRTGNVALSLVFPLLVVPNERLWVTHYDACGKRIRDPEPADRCSYYVHSSHYHPDAFTADEVTLSHLEFLTIDGLRAFVTELSDADKLDATFPIEHVLESAQRPRSDQDDLSETG